MQKSHQIILLIFGVSLSFFAAHQALALDVPTISATVIGPNQINLTWSAVANPGWGYKVEIQSNDVNETRYTTWTDLTESLVNGRNYLPYWVTESQYQDRANDTGTGFGTPCQFPVFSLRYGTTYNFRVRAYGKTDANVSTFGNYSNTVSAATFDIGTGLTAIKHVKASAGGANNGISEMDAWTTLNAASGVTAGTLVIIHGGTYTQDRIQPNNSGTQASKIWFVADKWSGETATMDGFNASWGYWLGLWTSYIVVDGIVMDNSNPAYPGNTAQAIVLNGSRNTIANTTMNLGGGDSTGRGYPPNIRTNGYNFLVGNTWGYWGSLNGQNGVFEIAGLGHNLLLNNHFHRCGHDCSNSNSIYNAFMNNGYDEGIGQLVCSTPGGSYTLIEGLISIDANKYVTDPGKPTFQLEADHMVFRRNVIILSRQRTLEITHQFHDSKIYNNVFYLNGRVGGNANSIFRFMFPVNTDFSNTEVANNVVYNNIGQDALSDTGYNLRTEVFIPYNTNVPMTNLILHNNLLLDKTSGADDPNRTIIDYYYDATNMTVAQADAAISPRDHMRNNYTTAPAFIDAANHEVHLTNTSFGRGLAQAVSVIAPWGAPISAGDDLGAYEYYNTGGTPPDTTPPAAPSGVSII